MLIALNTRKVSCSSGDVCYVQVPLSFYLYFCAYLSAAMTKGFTFIFIIFPTQERY